MEKFLIFIPVVKNPDVLKECLNAIMYKRNVDIIILLNGADEDIKQLVNIHYRQYPQIMIWENLTNEYVNKPWNQAIKFFLDHHEWDRLIIMNNDLTCQLDWDLVCREIWKYNLDYILIPTISNDKTKMYEHIPIVPMIGEYLENPAGVFITLNHKQAQLVYPIPEDLRVWFGDSYIFQLLRADGYTIARPYNLLAFHHTSMHVKSIEGILEIIEQDKITWQDAVEPILQEKIKQIKITK